MVVLRRDGSVYRANQRYADMLGYTLEEVGSLHVWGLGYPVQRAGTAENASVRRQFKRTF